MAYEKHVRSARQIIARCAVITVSDTRTPQTDTSGQRIAELLQNDGHQIIARQIVPDDPARLAPLLDDLLGRQDIDAVLTSGGTGISRRDRTIPVIQSVLDSPLPGFGEIFRMLSYEQIGSGAMLSRALGGIARGKVLFAMPGSTRAVELAMTRLVIPELRHLLFELDK